MRRSEVWSLRNGCRVEMARLSLHEIVDGGLRCGRSYPRTRMDGPPASQRYFCRVLDFSGCGLNLKM